MNALHVTTPPVGTRIGMPSPTVLVMGDADNAELRPVLSLITDNGLLNDATPACCATVDELVRRSVNDLPDLIVVLQSHPDEYRADDVCRIIDAAPLARLVVCWSGWCESDGRTRSAWPLSVRVPVRAAGGRLRRELEVITHQRTALPLTASRQETYAFDHGEELPAWATSVDRSSMVIVSPDRAYAECVVDQFRALGWSAQRTSWERLLSDDDPHPRALLLFDADPLTTDLVNHVRQRSERHPVGVHVALMGFSRTDDIDGLLGLGVAAVLTKLTPVADWLWTLTHVLQSDDPRFVDASIGRNTVQSAL